MMASETAALYERILALVPKDELVISYNEVVREEMSSVNRAMNDVSAVFAKLAEVRDAVTKLSNGSSGGRSESLLEVMDSTMELQSNLNRKLKSVLAEMDEGQTRKKTRIKTDESVGSGSGENPSSMQPPNQIGNILFRLDAETDRDRKSSINAADFSQKNCEEMVFKLTRLSAQERNSQIPAVLPALMKVMLKISLPRAIVTMKYLILWVHLGSDADHLLKAYRSFFEAVSPWINQLPNTKRALGLRRLYETLVVLVERQSLLASKETKGHVHLSYGHCALLLDAMMPEERRKYMPRLLSALKEEMAKEVSSDEQAFEISKTLKLVGAWARNDPRDLELLQLYGQIVEAAKSYAGSISSFMIRADLCGVTRKIEGTFHDLFKTTVQERTANALEWARQLNEENVSAEDVDEGIMMLDEVVHHKERGWKPTQSEAVLECCKLLREHAQLLEAGAIRGQRLAVIGKWRIYQTKDEDTTEIKESNK
ncbi:hypothetical protein PR002_g21189 [Phytophthora rubi]|uniref:Uncharacterized protein n=1 Tax=Phytophthora rubi TaxID=129364 RepID=A0A6A3J6G3_9STRA|nr:hypothetical protein PR002_g21189 [Phytophthora rubi]